MIKRLAQSILRIFGLQIARIPQKNPVPPPPAMPVPAFDRSKYLQGLLRQPRNPDLHLQYDIEASKFGKPYLAYAELKTAEFLGAEPQRIEEYRDSLRAAIPELKTMNHNQYFRFACLAAEIQTRAGRPGVSILDVGGGEGQLASFLPEISYCLAEPMVNGISGIDLPFLDRSFDYVVSCHVLEHIPVHEREIFMDQLLSKARYGVILLNPFQIDETLVEERLKLIIDITGADWAKEHLECSLPRVQDIEEFAARRGLQISVKPNGTMTTSLAFLFVDYFAARSGRSLLRPDNALP